MKKELKLAIKNLIETVDDELHDEENWYVQHFMPNAGTYWTEEKDCDENGNWGFVDSSVTITEEDALAEGQYELLTCKDKTYLEEFITQGEILDKVVELVRQIGLEIYDGKIN